MVKWRKDSQHSSPSAASLHTYERPNAQHHNSRCMRSVRQAAAYYESMATQHNPAQHGEGREAAHCKCAIRAADMGRRRRFLGGPKLAVLVDALPRQSVIVGGDAGLLRGPGASRRMWFSQDWRCWVSTGCWWDTGCLKSRGRKMVKEGVYDVQLEILLLCVQVLMQELIDVGGSTDGESVLWGVGGVCLYCSFGCAIVLLLLSSTSPSRLQQEVGNPWFLLGGTSRVTWIRSRLRLSYSVAAFLVLATCTPAVLCVVWLMCDRGLGRGLGWIFGV